MHKSLRWLTAIIIFSFLLGLSGNQRPTAQAAAWQTKVDPWVISAAETGETEFLVFLQAQAELNAAASLESKTAKGVYVYETLTAIAATSQKDLRTQLDKWDIPYQAFWIVNALWVRGDSALISTIAQRSDVAHIYANPQVQLSLPAQTDRHTPQTSTAIEPNLLQINADDVWAAGYTGQNVVIGGADTGYIWDHPALINQYRGWDGTTARHDYNWFDATEASPNTPVDPYGHGTHTMGTMVGDDGGSNQVGVAPGAQWIGCRNMDSSGYGTPARYIACYQWFLAPTQTDGTNPRPDLASGVINNSWGCPTSEGCTDPGILLAAVENVNAAGILTVHSAGNSGYSGCGTINQPAAIYEDSFTVAAVNSSDMIASFSSRGPVTVDGSNRRKPNISAPGVSIRSTTNNGGYGYKQGTSMAAPHIAGVAALLISAHPVLSGQVEILKNLIEETAVPLYTNEGCGGDISTSRPNNTYGWGRVDAWAAYQEIPQGMGVNKTAPESVVPGNILTYTLTVTNSHPFSDTHNIVLTDTLPDRTAFYSATGNYTTTGRLVTWELGDLAAQAATQVELAVRVSEGISGTITNALFGAVSDEVPTAAQGEAVTSIVHEPGISWWVSSDCFNRWLAPGETLTCQHRIYNAGNYTDTIELSETSIHGEVEVSPITSTLGSGQNIPVTVRITAPGKASGGTEITTTVEAASKADPTVIEPLAITTWVYYRWFIPLIFGGN